jgi:hypothetical protein
LRLVFLLPANHVLFPTLREVLFVPETSIIVSHATRATLANRFEIDRLNERDVGISRHSLALTLPLLAASCVLALAACGCGSWISVPAARVLSLQPSTVQFGNVPVGVEAYTNVNVSNLGSGTVVLSQVEIAGQTFSVVSGSSLPVSIPGGGTHILKIGFAPASTVDYSGVLSVMDASAQMIAQIAMYGRGTAPLLPQLSVSATSLSFGDVLVNGNAIETLRLDSIGDVPVTVNSTAISGASFSVASGSFPVTLNPGQSMTILVQFQPAAAGPANGQLSVRSNSSAGATTVVALSGTGGAAPNPQLTASTNSLNFGSVTVDTAVPQTVTLASTGTSSATVNSAAISGAGFTLPGERLPITLNPGRSMTLVIQFQPTASGAASGQLSISSNSSTGATTLVALSGTGIAEDPELSTDAASLSFGSVAVNVATTSTLMLNSTGTTPVIVSSARIQAADFTVVGGSFPVTLNPGQFLTLLIRFQPTTAGATAGQLIIVSNSIHGGSVAVPLSGTGTTVAHEVDLSWLAPSSSPDPVAGYNIYRSVSGGGFAKINSSLSAPTTYVDNAIVSSVSYGYVVKSVDASGVESIASNEYQVTVP